MPSRNCERRALKSCPNLLESRPSATLNVRNKMSDLDSKPKGRQRASTPRSKTGCITCKMRRLKCGEEKPGCVRCQKSGWRCDGYEHGSSSNVKKIESRTPSPRGSLSSSSMTVNLDEQERSYFQVYVDQQTTFLDHKDPDAAFWKRIVLRECHSNPCVRHIIVASGALAKSSVARMPWGYFFRINGPQDPHHQFALIQYEKALRGLRASIGGLEKGRGAHTTLVSSLALSIFDCFCGNGGFAAQHVRFGRKLLASWRSASAENQSHLSPDLESPVANRDPIEDGLTRIFLCLDVNILCAMGIDDECDYDNTLFIEAPRTNFALQFTNFDEARRARNIMIFDGYQFFLRAAKYQFLPPEEIPETMFTLRQYWLDQVQFWNTAFDPILQSCSLDETIHPLARPESLRLQTIMMFLRITSTLHTPEIVYDTMISQFEYLIAIAEDVIEFEKMHSPIASGSLMDPLLFQENPILPGPVEDIETFSAEVRIIPALYLVATKCRFSNLRHQAIAMLLSSPRRESIWDSILCGKVAQWMAGLEEGAVLGERCWAQVVERDLNAKKIVARCRFGHNQPGQWEERNTVIEW